MRTIFIACEWDVSHLFGWAFILIFYFNKRCIPSCDGEHDGTKDQQWTPKNEQNKRSFAVKFDNAYCVCALCSMLYTRDASFWHAQSSLILIIGMAYFFSVVAINIGALVRHREHWCCVQCNAIMANSCRRSTCARFALAPPMSLVQFEQYS